MVDSPNYSLLKDIEVVLKPEITDTGVFNDIVQKLSFVLNSYKIDNKGEQIILKTDENLDLISRYGACLLVEGKAESTIEAYTSRIKHMYNTSHINLKDMGPYDIRFYIALCKNNGCSNRTLEGIRSYIVAFYKWMFIEGFVERNPCDPIKPIKYKSEIKKSFSELDIEKIRSSCNNPKERALVEFLLSTGVRVSELEQMNVTDVDFMNNSVHVKHGKGDKERITYMSPVAAYYLSRYLETRKDSDPELFKSNKGRLQSGGIRWILSELGQRSCVENVHPHRFRRTFATGLNTKGMAIQNIQHLLGHTKIDTTMIYVNVDDNAVHSEYLRCMNQ